ncbi:MAG: FKBP-type peptidyl-prolyl cis-trans isomerase [Pseudomonadota bacterium]|nr:FKBP-type peptidyl-prolyl cis-trans isomerase [Pseudomonadota bacterium]
MKFIATAILLSTSLFAVAAHAATAVAPPKPQVTMGLQKIDTVVGKGKVAEPGQMVTVNYTGWLYMPKAPNKHGMQFDSSIGREPFTFGLGGGQVIPGWDQGVAGMKVGGKRTLIIPAAMGYGARGAGPIPANADLIFDVELLETK